TVYCRKVGVKRSWSKPVFICFRTTGRNKLGCAWSATFASLVRQSMKFSWREIVSIKDLDGVARRLRSLCKQANASLKTPQVLDSPIFPFAYSTAFGRGTSAILDLRIT